MWRLELFALSRMPAFFVMLSFPSTGRCILRDVTEDFTAVFFGAVFLTAVFFAARFRATTLLATLPFAPFAAMQKS